MSRAPGSFRPGELDGPDPSPGDAELAVAWSMARELESALPPETIGPSAGFTDAVMAAVALEPAPRRAGFLAALRARPGLAGLAASVREAWTVAAGGPGRTARARGLALAYVLAVALVVTSLTGFAAYGAAGALGFFDDDRSPSPSVVLPSPAASPSTLPEPAVTPEASSLPESSPSAEPGPSAESSPSAEPARTAKPTGRPSPRPSDDVSPSPPASSAGPTASPDHSDDHGDSSPSPGLDDESSPEPTGTPDS